MSMVLYVGRYIFKSSRVYNWNNDSSDPGMNISLGFYSVTEWVATLLPITSHQRTKMVITEGFPGWLPDLDSLVFTVEKDTMVIFLKYL